MESSWEEYLKGNRADAPPFTVQYPATAAAAAAAAAAGAGAYLGPDGAAPPPPLPPAHLAGLPQGGKPMGPSPRLPPAISGSPFLAAAPLPPSMPSPAVLAAMGHPAGAAASSATAASQAAAAAAAAFHAQHHQQQQQQQQQQQHQHHAAHAAHAAHAQMISVPPPQVGMRPGAPAAVATAATAATLQSGGPSQRIAVACAPCHHAKSRCDYARPCRRCVRTGRESECVDRPHRKKGRPRKNTAGSAGGQGPNKRARGVSADSAGGAAGAAAAAAAAAATASAAAASKEEDEEDEEDEDEVVDGVLRTERVAELVRTAADVRQLLSCYQLAPDSLDEWVEAEAEAIRRLVQAGEHLPQSLKLTHDVFNKMYERMPFGVYTVPLKMAASHEGQNLWVNDAFLKLMGRSRENMLHLMSTRGRSLETLYPSDQAAMVYGECIRAVRNRARSWTSRCIFQNSAGFLVPAVVSRTIEYESGLAASLTTFVQVDFEHPLYGTSCAAYADRRRAEEQAASTARAAALASGILDGGAGTGKDDGA